MRACSWTSLPSSRPDIVALAHTPPTCTRTKKLRGLDCNRLCIDTRRADYMRLLHIHTPRRTNLSESIELADYTRPCETKPGKTTGREHERQYQILLLLRSLRGGTLSCPFVSAVLAVPDHRTTHMQIDDSTTSPQCRRRHALRRVSQFGPSYRVLHASDLYPGRSRHASHRHCLCYWCPGDESLL